MGLLQQSDFDDGYYCLPGDKFSKLPAFLTEFNDDSILMPMFGLAEYVKYVADLDVLFVPQTAPYTTIFNKLQVEIDHYLCCALPYPEHKTNRHCKELINTIGIRDMLKGFVYYEFLVTFPFQKTPTGNKMMLSANSTATTDTQNNSDAEARFNRSVTTYRQLQNYMCANEVDFPDFAGFTKDYKMEGIF